MTRFYNAQYFSTVAPTPRLRLRLRDVLANPRRYFTVNEDGRWFNDPDHFLEPGPGLIGLIEDAEKGFTFTARNPEGFMVDVFVKTHQTRKSKALVDRIIAARPDWFTEAGTRTMYASPGTVRSDGTVAWSDYIWPRLRRAVMTMKWYDSLNRMEIEISGKGFGGYGGWEDEDRVLILEV